VQGSVPGVWGFGENDAGFTGMFEVKKKARREAQNEELEFPDPVETIREEKPKKAKKSGEGKGRRRYGSAYRYCCCTSTVYVAECFFTLHGVEGQEARESNLQWFWAPGALEDTWCWFLTVVTVALCYCDS